MFNYILPIKMFQQQNGLVDPKEVPLVIGLSFVTKLKTDIKKIKLTFATDDFVTVSSVANVSFLLVF